MRDAMAVGSVGEDLPSTPAAPPPRLGPRRPARHAGRARGQRAHGYPPDKQERATQTVLEQAAVLSEHWALTAGPRASCAPAAPAW